MGDAALFLSRRTSPKLVPLECQDRTPTVVHVICGRFAVSFRVEQPSRGLPVRRHRGLVGQSTCLATLLGEYGQMAGRAEGTLATRPTGPPSLTHCAGNHASAPGPEKENVYADGWAP